jgi:hypothetical protein
MAFTVEPLPEAIPRSSTARMARISVLTAGKCSGPLAMRIHVAGPIRRERLCKELST